MHRPLENASPFEGSTVEALPTTTGGLSIGVGKTEASANQIIGVVNARTSQIEGTFGVHDNRSPTAIDQDVPPAGGVHEPELIAEPIAASANDGHTKESGVLLMLKEG